MSDKRPRRNDPQKKSKRRALRRSATPAEARLWTFLKGRQVEGMKFRRQFGVGEVILDFFCPELSLAVELDGEVHEGPIAAANDVRRTSWLESQGISVIRFENRVVFEKPDWVLQQIREEIRRAQSR